MDFKQAWKAVGNPSPGNTTWSADVDGKPVFTAWRNREFKFDKNSGRTAYFSPPGNWIERGEGQSYLRRVRLAIQSDWVCRLIVLDGSEPWEKAKSAELDEVLYAVRFDEVNDDGSIRGRTFTRAEYLKATTYEAQK